MSLLRRRVPPRDDNQLTSHTTETRTSSNPRYYHAFTAVLVACIVYLALMYSSFTKSTKPLSKILTFSTPPDEETTLSTHALPYEDYQPADFRESALICMPTVKRAHVEYVTNSIKSFRLATRNSTALRRLIVYNMDHPPTNPTWLPSIFAGREVRSVEHLPSWLDIQPRHGDVLKPRKATLGDSQERVLWRSKEALDYAQVLDRCAASTNADWLIIVQDDVLFRPTIINVIKWANEQVIDTSTTVNGRRVARVCSASLFDIAEQTRVNDGDELRSSNMVARVWRRRDVPAWVNFFNDRFDDAPIDWLADRRCRGRRGWVTVMWPNPVRHRGKVSSFSKNQREALLT